MSRLAESGNSISWNQYGKPQSHGIAAACNHKQAVIDARISYKEQEKSFERHGHELGPAMNAIR